MISLAALAVVLAAPPPGVEVFSVAQGLPTPYPRSIVRTADGALWAPLMAAQGLQREGVVRVDPATHAVARWRAPNGLPSDQVDSLACDGRGNVWAATDAGLATWGPADSTARVVSTAASHHVVGLPTGGAWALASAGVVIATGDTPARVLAAPPCRDVRRVIPLGPQTGAVVCQDGVLWVSGGTAHALRLRGTLLEGPHHTGTERRAPPIWLFDAAPDGDQAVLVIGHTRRLTRLAGDGAPTEVGTRQTAPLHALAFATRDGASGPRALVVDATGQLWRLTADDHLEAVRVDACVDAAHIDATGAAWVVTRPCPEAQRRGAPEAPYAVRRLADGARPELRVALGPPGTSPGLLALVSDGAGGLWAATNDGFWRFGGR